MYRTLFYVNIYGSYKLSKNSPVFLAHPVVCLLYAYSFDILVDAQKFYVLEQKQIVGLYLSITCKVVTACQISVKQ